MIKERAPRPGPELSAESVAAGDATGWFERLYAEAEAGVSGGPVGGRPAGSAPGRVGGPRGSAGSDGAGRRALVVGCGLGYDAEFLAGRGFAVTAFDLSPTAIAGAKRLYLDSRVTYLAADLLDLPAAWAGAFDLVVEAYTVQPLYGPVRERALAALPGPVAPGGSLLVIARATERGRSGPRPGHDAVAAHPGRARAGGRPAARSPDREVPRRRGAAPAAVAGRVPPRRLSG